MPGAAGRSVLLRLLARPRQCNRAGKRDVLVARCGGRRARAAADAWEAAADGLPDCPGSEEDDDDGDVEPPLGSDASSDDEVASDEGWMDSSSDDGDADLRDGFVDDEDRDADADRLLDVLARWGPATDEGTGAPESLTRRPRLTLETGDGGEAGALVPAAVAPPAGVAMPAVPPSPTSSSSSFF